MKRVALMLSWLTFATSLALAADAPSVTNPPRLKLLIENPGQHAEACNLDQPALKAIAALTLRNNRIRVAEDSESGVPYLHVMPGLLPSKMKDGSLRGCFGQMHISVKVVMPLIEMHGFSPREGAYLTLCEAGYYFSSNVGDFSSAFLKYLEQEIKLCLGQIDY